jgi:hypothetical protein
MHEVGTGRPGCSRTLGKLGVSEIIIRIITTLAIYV